MKYSWMHHLLVVFLIVVFENSGLCNELFISEGLPAQLFLSVNCSPNTGGTVSGFLDGAIVVNQQPSLQAIPNSGYQFLNWTEAGNGTVYSSEPAITLPFAGPHTFVGYDLIANFQLVKTYRITTISFPTTTGATTGDGTYREGDNVTVTATPKRGYSFASWTEGETVVSSSSTYSFSASRDRNLKANFQQTLVDVSGRVLNKKTRAPIVSATVTLTGSTTLTKEEGKFSFSQLDLTGGGSLQVDKPGFEPYTRSVPAPPVGAKSIVLPDVLLSPDELSVTNVEGAPEGIYLQGAGLKIPFTANVNWGRTTPGTVSFYANDCFVQSIDGKNSDYKCTIDIEQYFKPVLRAGGNKLRVIAQSAEGLSSDPFDKEIDYIPLPGELAQKVAGSLIQINKAQIKAEFDFDPVSEINEIPLVGSTEVKFGWHVKFLYTIPGGAWEISSEDVLGKEASAGASKLLLGAREITGSFYGISKGTASVTQGIVIDETSGGLNFSADFVLGRFGLLDLLLESPGASMELAKVPGLEDFVDDISLLFLAKPSLDGALNFKAVKFTGGTLTGKIGLEAAYEPKITKDLEARFYVGGEPSLELGLPPPVFKSIEFRFYAGLEFTAWVLKFGGEWVIVDYTFPSSAAGRRLSMTGVYDIGTGYLIEGVRNKEVTPKIIDRSYWNGGPEQFVLAVSGSAAQRLTLPSGTDEKQALNLFSRMGNSVAPGAVYQPPTSRPSRRIMSDPNLPTQAALPLLQNVFPQASPCLAGKGNELMLLYVRDTGAQQSVQFTEIAWTRFDGTSWSAPASIQSDVRAQFAPQVCYDGSGNAVAVWEQVKDANFQGTDISAYGAQMEVMSARWNATAGTWDPPQALTNNNFLDHGAHLAGPLANGDLVLTWSQNEQNQLIASGTANDRIMTTRWKCAAQAWSTPEVLVYNLSNHQSESLDAAGQKAVYCWIQDMDGNISDNTDTELLCRVFDLTSGTWSNSNQYTNDNLVNLNARIKVDPSGTVYMIWQRGTDLVMSKNFDSNTSLVRADSSTTGFTDNTLTLGPGGNIVLLWEEMDVNGPDAHFRVYDPASDTWSQDTLLSADSDLEKGFSTVWDSMGNLTLAYSNVQIAKKDVNVTVDGGNSITVSGVPQPGETDLLVAKRAIVKDISIPSSGFTVGGNDFYPGDTLTLSATVNNTGNVAIQNVKVSFYNGDPALSGTVINTQTITGWLKGGDSYVLTGTWTVPEPAIARTLYAVIDPDNAVTESNEANNMRAVNINGVDLELSLLTKSVEQGGSVRVVAQVKNIGAPASPITKLKLWPQDNPGTTPLSNVDVSALEPGELVQLVMELPAGSQMEGDAFYRMTVDGDNISGDVDTTNNVVTFSLNLFISTANDGIPDWWKRKYDFSITDSTVTNADTDGDGFTNYQEYLCGTDPRDPSSRLKTGQMHVVMSPDGKTGQFTITWVPVENGAYALERSFDMKTWTAVETHIQATPPLNSYTDTAVIPSGVGRCFYRVRVE